MPSMLRIKNCLTSLLRALAVVFLGVLIALLLNSWNESRKEKIQAQQYLDGVYEEVKDNITILEEAIPYHKRWIPIFESWVYLVRILLGLIKRDFEN